MFSASTDIWRYQFHPEVWIIVISSVLLAFYATRVVGPNAVKDNEPVITRKHKYAFVAAIAFCGSLQTGLCMTSQKNTCTQHICSNT